MKYFSIKELTKSNTAYKNHICNIPTIAETSRIIELIEKCLDPIREMWGGPIKVNSGYRCQKLNEIVGGAKNSSHLRGEAADITTGSKIANKALYNMIMNNFEYDQLIDEKDYSWLHISWRGTNNRNQTMHLK